MFEEREKGGVRRQKGGASRERERERRYKREMGRRDAK